MKEESPSIFLSMHALLIPRHLPFKRRHVLRRLGYRLPVDVAINVEFNLYQITWFGGINRMNTYDFH